EANGSEETNDICPRWKLPPARRAADIVGQRLARDVVHDHVGAAALSLSRQGDMGIVELDDVGVPQGCYHLGFTEETGHEHRIILQFRAEKLDGDKTAQLEVKGFPDLAHPSPS